MAKQITPDQAFALSFSPFRYRRIVTDSGGRAMKDEDGNLTYELASVPRFIKQGETQASALKRLRNHSLGRTAQRTIERQFPTFIPGVTSAATYVAQFEAMNKLVRTGSASHLTHPSPVPEGPELEVSDECADLV